MIIIMDIDGIIKNKKPIGNKIDYLNHLYNKGHRIVIWAEGEEISPTIKLLEKCNVKYNELKMGKPYYDLIIDEKSVNNLYNI